MNIYIYTMGFPYGAQETFLENEIGFLSDNFEKVFIVPFKKKSPSVRSFDCPENCIVLEPVFDSTLRNVRFRDIPLLLINLIKLFPFPINNSAISNALICSIIQSRFFKSQTYKVIQEGSNIGDIHYFYWGYGLVYILEKLKKNLGNNKFIVRFHGFDLYEERHGGWLPVRNKLIHNADQLHFISEQGKEYFNSRYPLSQPKSYTSYLGVDDGMNVSRNMSSDTIIFYSCSNVISLKRVDLVFECVAAYSVANPNEKVHWDHYGDGDLYVYLSDLISHKSFSNLTITLHGRRKMSDIFINYQRRNRSIFINLSTTEGLPVSIMEAMSHNIPILATDVGGVKEMVTSDVGCLVDVNESIVEIAKKLEYILNNYCVFEPYSKWKEKFNSSSNYESFVEKIKR